jgi:multidrug efflux pump
MNGFNLSEWALRHQALVRYFILVLAVVGVMAYQRLSQSEDPPFTFKVMVIRTLWPGATAREVEQQVTDRIEKKLQEAPYADIIRSYSKPGESNVFFLARDSTPPMETPNVFYQVRKKIGDIRHTLPAGIQGPFFNDEFGDTLGNVYALIGDGYDYAALKHYADKLRDELLRVKDVAKVELIGEQDERIYVELSSTRLATLGIDLQTLLGALASQNAVAAAGSFETGFDRIYLRPGGAFDSVERIRELSIRAGGRLLRLGDIAEVKRSFADPPQPRMRFMGSDALGVGVSMAKGGDIIALGRHLDAAVARIQHQLPLGLELHAVASQPAAVARSINEFVRALAEAVAIVLVVSFFSLGFRTGLVVALSIPLVLALTFFFMYLFGVGLHKISLGALILALGLLVDDAIIAVEMMAVKMEQGWDRVKAASFAYTSTAMPMLTGTLVTAAGFLPIATAASSTGEYTRSIFQVSVIALLISWFAAVIVIPYLGFRLLPDQHGKRGESGVHEVYDSPFYRRFRQVVRWCVRYRKTVILVTLLAFALAVAGFRFVQEQFFPASTRLELLVDLRLAEGSSLPATEAQVKKLEALLAREKGIENFVAYVGSGSPRFYLPLDQQLPNSNFAQFVVLTRSLQDRERVRSWLIKLFEDDFTELRGVVQRLENGPPVGFPVQFRVSGEDIATVRKLAYEVAQVMRANRNLSNVQFDWDEQTKVIRLGIDQAKARVLGISSEELANVLNAALSGIRATVYRENDKQIDVLVRGTEVERMQLSFLRDLAIPTRSGKSVAVSQIASLDYGLEEGVIWRRNRLPTITVRANVYGDIQAPAVTGQISPLLDPIRAKLPPGYFLQIGGAAEESAKGGGSVAAGVPLFVVTVVTILMLQLQNFSRTALVLLTAPLGMIGVTLFLLAFDKPFGFVAMLGTIALSGMIMRNSVILVDQIEQDIEAGLAPWNAIVEATVRRFRPIMLTAAAAILAMVPLSRSVFFGPMAVAIMGGLLVATLLTLLFLPALYAAWFRVREAESSEPAALPM